MARINNLTNFITDIATAIKSKLGTNNTITPANFDTLIMSINTVIGEEISVTPTTSQQVITPSAGKNAITQVTVNPVTSNIDADIVAGNIKKDVEILGVTGTYEGATINNQDKTITQNGSYTADANYTGLGTVVVDVDTGIDTSDATANANDIINPKTAYVDGQKVIGSIIPTEVELSPTITYNVNSSINTIKPSAFRDDLIVRRDGSTLLVYQMVNNTITTLITSTDFFSNTYELGKVLQLSEAFVAQNGTDKEYLLGYTEGPQPPADTAIKYLSQYNDFLKFARINYTNGVWTITKMESSFTPLASGFMSFKFVQDSQNKNLLHFVITGGRYYSNSCQYLIQFYNATYTVGENIVFGNNLSYEIVYGANGQWAWTATMRIDLVETTTGHWDALVFMCQHGIASYLPNHSWSGTPMKNSTYIRFGLSDNFSTRVYTVTDRQRTSQNVLSTPQEILLSNGYLIKVDATTSNSNLTLNLYKPNTTTGVLGSALNILTIPSPYYNQYDLNISLRDMDNAIVIIANYYGNNTSTSPTGKYRVVYIDNERLVAGPTTSNTLTNITLDDDYVIRGSGSNGDNLVLISSTNGLHIVKKEKNIKIVALDRDADMYYNPYDATANNLNILSGRIAYGVNGKITGAMPNNGILDITPSTSQQTIPAGYTSGGTVRAVDNTIDANITQANIKAGVTILGVTGNLEPDKPDQTKTATPTTSQQTIEPDNGYELASVTVEAVDNTIDANIIAANIKKDVTILGVTGTLEGGIDTSDATATAGDIAAGVTAYVNGVKLTGTIQDTRGSTYALPAITVTYNQQTGRVIMVPDMNNDMIFSSDSLYPYVEDADLATAIGLTANKIVSGNSILGIAGTGGSGTTQTKTITANGTYTPDSGYVGFSEVTVNVVDPEYDDNLVLTEQILGTYVESE